MSASFASFADVMERIRQARGPVRRATLWETYCALLPDTDQRTVLNLVKGPLPSGLPWTSLRIPKATLLALLSDLSGWDNEILLWVLKAEGSIPSAYGALLPDRADDPRLTLAHVADTCAELASLKGVRRLPVLRELLGHASPQSAKTILQLLSRTLPFTPAGPIEPAKPIATLFVTIIAATADHAERSTLLSDYTIAVLNGESFLSVGTVWEGLPASEVETISNLLQSIPGERRGDAWLVDPRMVLEVSCTGIRENRRRQSGFELCGPRILAWRTDIAPSQIASLEQVIELTLPPASLGETTAPRLTPIQST